MNEEFYSDNNQAAAQMTLAKANVPQGVLNQPPQPSLQDQINELVARVDLLERNFEWVCGRVM